MVSLFVPLSLVAVATAPLSTVVSQAATPRGLPLLGLGNELVWQSVNDSALAAAVKATGSQVGRYPGGTPSDYWDWRIGWASDVGGAPIRRATPADWVAYANASGTSSSIIVVNQLTANLSEALLGLEAHANAGTAIKFVELGNEMYDSTRADVVAAYPNGSSYVEKMAAWAAAIKARHASARVAVLAMTWRPDNGPRETAWNTQVFGGGAELLANVSAATLHPYFGISWDGGNQGGDRTGGGCGTGGLGASGPWIGTEEGCNDSCCCQVRCGGHSDCEAWQYMTSGDDAGACYLKSSSALQPNAASVSGLASPPSPPSPPSASAIANVLKSAFYHADRNHEMVSSSVPEFLDLWVTEVAAYGASSLNFTWLEALVNVLFETLLLLRTRQITAMTPYCIVCGDPIAPNFISSSAQSSPATHSVVPPALAGRAAWNQTLRSAAHGAYFRLVAEARAAHGEGAQLAELTFAPNPPLCGSTTAMPSADTAQFVGWRTQNAGCTRGIFVMNLGAANATLSLSGMMSIGEDQHCLEIGTGYEYLLLFPRTAQDVVRPLVPLKQFGQINSTGQMQHDAPVSQQALQIDMPPYSILSFRRT